MKTLLESAVIFLILFVLLVTCQENHEVFGTKDTNFVVYPMDVYDYQAPRLNYGSAMPRKRLAMGIDIPDYLMHYKGNNPNLAAFRERMQLNGRR